MRKVSQILEATQTQTSMNKWYHFAQNWNICREKKQHFPSQNHWQHTIRAYSIMYVLMDVMFGRLHTKKKLQWSSLLSVCLSAKQHFWNLWILTGGDSQLDEAQVMPCSKDTGFRLFLYCDSWNKKKRKRKKGEKLQRSENKFKL